MDDKKFALYCAYTTFVLKNALYDLLKNLPIYCDESTKEKIKSAIMKHWPCNIPEIDIFLNGVKRFSDISVEGKSILELKEEVEKFLFGEEGTGK